VDGTPGRLPAAISLTGWVLTLPGIPLPAKLLGVWGVVADLPAAPQSAALTLESAVASAPRWQSEAPSRPLRIQRPP